MKRFFFALTFLLPFSCPLAAKEYTKDEICAEVGLTAGLLMDFRQSLLPMSRMVAIYADHPVAREMVIAAYEQPRFRTDQAKRQAKADFSDEWSLKCYKDELGGPVTWLAE